MNYPANIDRIKRFERNNPTIKLYLYYFEVTSSDFVEIYPLHISYYKPD